MRLYAILNFFKQMFFRVSDPDLTFQDEYNTVCVQFKQNITGTLKIYLLGNGK